MEFLPATGRLPNIYKINQSNRIAFYWKQIRFWCSQLWFDFHRSYILSLLFIPQKAYSVNFYLTLHCLLKNKKIQAYVFRQHWFQCNQSIIIWILIFKYDAYTVSGILIGLSIAFYLASEVIRPYICAQGRSL